jgi:hypothetical protein
MDHSLARAKEKVKKIRALYTASTLLRYRLYGGYSGFTSMGIKSSEQDIIAFYP